jgi:hypothetical protein
MAQAKEDLPTRSQSRQLAKKQIACFERNRSKMMYQTFRQAAYFIGSGVVETGCKTVMGQRLKQPERYDWGKRRSRLWSNAYKRYVSVTPGTYGKGGRKGRTVAV